MLRPKLRLELVIGGAGLPRAKLACGRVAARQNRIKALAGASRLHGSPAGVMAWRGESFPHASWWRHSCPRLEPRVMAHASVGVVGGARVRRRLVVRVRDLSCEAETCRRGSLS
jgi:hypothetical protein